MKGFFGGFGRPAKMPPRFIQNRKNHGGGEKVVA